MAPSGPVPYALDENSKPSFEFEPPKVHQHELEKIDESTVLMEKEKSMINQGFVIERDGPMTSVSP